MSIIAQTAPTAYPTMDTDIDARLSSAYLAYLRTCATGTQAEIEAALRMVQRVERKVGLTQHLAAIKASILAEWSLR